MVMNEREEIEQAQQALNRYADFTGMVPLLQGSNRDREEVLSSLLRDLIYWAYSENINFFVALAYAKRLYGGKDLEDH